MPKPTAAKSPALRHKFVTKATKGRQPSGAQRDDAATRRIILEAALQAFSIHGFEGASIASVASMAKSSRVSPPLIHYYFKNKEELWRSTIEFGLGDILHELRDIIHDLDGIGHVLRLKFFVKRYIALIAARPEVFQIIIRESETLGARLTWLVDNYLSNLYLMVLDIISKAQEAGDVKRIVPAYHVAQIIIGACYHFIGSRHRMREAYGIDVLSPQIRTEHVNAVLDILFTGLLSPAAAAEQASAVSAATPEAVPEALSTGDGHAI